MATSVPVPMDRPRSAWASAGASLTPSPTMATTRPSACRRRMTSALSEGRTSAMTSSMPTSAATARAVVSLSPVSRTGRSPSACSDATASADVVLDGVGDDEHGAWRVRPSRRRSRSARAPRRPGGRRRARPGRCMRPVGRAAAGRPTMSACPSTMPSTPRPSRLAKPSTAASGPAAAGGRGDGLRDRVLGGVLERADQAQRLVALARRRRRRPRRGSSCRWSRCRSCRARRCRPRGWTPGPRGP